MHRNNANPADASSEETRDLAEEVEALLEYAAEQDLLASDDLEKREQLRVQLVEPLVVALREYQLAPEQIRFEKKANLLFAYSALTALTGDVTGRSLIDSHRCSEHLSKLMWWTGVFLAVAIATELVRAGIFVELSPPPEAAGATGETVSSASPQPPTDNPGMLLDIPWLSAVLLDILAFSWGGLGACVFLLKTLSDKARAFTFDNRLLQGVATRIWLGAILGTVVPHLFNLTGGEDQWEFDVVAVAFLTGISVKVVYGAIEKTVEALAERFNLGALRRAPVREEFVVAPPRAGAQAGAPARPRAEIAAVPEAAAASPAPASFIREAQELLSGLGINPGAIDGVMGPQTVEAVRAFLGDATKEDAAAVERDALLRWLREGKAPSNWREALASGKEQALSAAVVLGAEEVAANRRMLEQLKERDCTAPDIDESDPRAVLDMVSRGIERLVAANPGLSGLSFTRLLDELETDRERALRCG